MPRQLRELLPEGVYHVTSRGNRRERLFHTPDAFEEYLKLLRRLSERYGVDVLAYVLMPNHVHLLLHASEAVLPASRGSAAPTSGAWRRTSRASWSSRVGWPSPATAG